MNVLSLYDGISCGRIAFERAKININKYVAYEIDENAIEISRYNYSDIIRGGDVFKADFSAYKNFDFLIGGSPCTYWNIARHNGREIKASGLGWELFSQYVRSLNIIKPKWFIYENNFSMSKEIKDSISETFSFEPIMINSSLVSGQGRKRLYWVGKFVNDKYEKVNVVLPKDKNIFLNDVVDFSKEKFKPVGNWVFNTWGTKRKIDSIKSVNSKKSSTLTTSKTHPMNYYLNSDKTKYCNLTVKDWEGLQTLPEGYVDNVNVKEGAKYKAIGNGWTVDVIVHLINSCLHEQKELKQFELF